MTKTSALLVLALLARAGAMEARAEAHERLTAISFPRVVHHLRAQGYRSYRRLPAGRSDFFSNDAGDGAIRRRYPELAYCSGTGLNHCVFLFMRSARAIIEVQTTGERPDGLAVASIERISRDRATEDDHRGCDIGPSPSMPCPR